MRFGRKKSVRQITPQQEALALRISSGIIRMQRQVAISLNRKAGRLSAGQLRLLFILFCLLFGGISLYFIISSLFMNPLN